MTALARRLGCTEGQLYTAVIGAVLAAALFIIGIPPALRSERPAAAANASDAARPTTTVAPPRSTTTTTPGASFPTGSPATTTQPPSQEAQNSAPPPAPGPPASSTTTRSVIDAGYTSATAGTPLSGPEVPDDGMPVGVRLGRVDKMSFARLAGSGPVLSLRLVDSTAANQLVALARVRACAVTESGWSLEEPGAPPEDAPAFDARRCVDGVTAADGTWSFHLDEIGTIDDAAGIALVPVSEGAGTFQVTFSTVAVAEDP